MSIQNITPNSSFSYSCSSVDSEEKEIMRRLLAYGYTPTGNKTTDKAQLRKIEIEKAKQDNYVSDKYLTVSQAECQKIQDTKKQKHKLDNPEKSPALQEKRQGAKLMGEQIFLAIKMKDEKRKFDTKKNDEKVLRKDVA